MKYFDNLVIGAGIGGTYLSSRLKKIKPYETILLIDKKEEYGGQQISTITNDNVAIELGPVRFYESIHLRVLYLAKKYNTPLIQYLPSFTGQVMYLRDKPYNTSSLFPDSDKSYNINANEIGKDPFVLLVNNLQKLIPNIDELYKLEYRIQLLKDYPEFSIKTFQDLAQMDISQENWQRIMDILGYYDLLSNESAFIINALELLVLSNKSEKQYRFKKGYSSLTRLIAYHNKISTITFNKINNKNIPKTSCLFNTQILKITKYKYSNLWIVKCGYTIVNSPEQINNKITKIEYIKVKNIYYCAPIQFLSNIYNFNNTYLNYLKDSFLSLSAIRIYLRYSEDWMTQRGIELGKSVTTLPGGQIIHYDDKYVMFYVFGSQANVLYSKFPSKQIQKNLIKPTKDTYSLITECNKILKTTFSIKENLPPVTGIAWATWIEPFRLYTARNLQTLDNNTTLVSMLDKLMFPFGKNGNFYIMSNEISLNAAWCEGSLENVDYFLNKKYNQPLFGPEML
jgi:hypothetical protein